MKKVLLAFLLVAVIALSGCVGQRPVNIDANNGLLISTFSVDPLKVEEGEDVSFLMDIENVGGVTATDINVNFYGAEGWDSVEEKTIAELEPPNPISNTPGDFKTVSVVLTAPPDLPQGVQVTYPITARATYDYKTTGSIIIPAYSKTLYKIKTDKGETIDTTPKVENTNSPIKVSLSRGPTPIIVDEEEGEETTYVLEFANVGSGWPVTEEGIGEMTGTIKVEGADLVRCLEEDAVSNTVTFDVDTLKMRSSGKVPVSCDVKVPSGWSTTQSGSIVFMIDIDFGYYVEKTANIMVWGGEK
ncbi:MAG: hypothetical protein NT129_00125 [Candidatus Aenigmarchaeota archaeon]|nr:hypothetical protein [Candidatus Aenigmarchaeota archaeon]